MLILDPLIRYAYQLIYFFAYRCNDNNDLHNIIQASTKLTMSLFGSTVVCINYVAPATDKLYAFDLDGTITHTRTGKILPVDEHDYCPIDQIVLDKLATITHCYIITNQKRMTPADHRMQRLKNIYADLVAAGVSCTIIAATDDDKYRKPYPGIYQTMVHPGLQRMLFVGDAAGRSGDFADSDRAFAYNCSFINARLGMTQSLVSFQTPEIYFYNRARKPYTWSNEIPENTQQKTFMQIDRMSSTVANYPNTYNLVLMQCVQLAMAHLTLFIMCGRPGSGKSTFANHLATFSSQITTSLTIASNDICGNFNKTKIAVRSMIKSDPNISIIIDNTNPGADVRQFWVDYATSINLVPIIVWMDVPEATAHYNNALRVMNNQKPVPKIAYNIFAKHFTNPTECQTLQITYASNVSEYFGMRISI